MGSDCPTIEQDFGHSETDFTGSGGGEIGGIVRSSTTPAWYSTGVGPFSFRDKLSASGRLMIRRSGGRAGAYVGFFNSSRTGWRPWSSMMMQLSGSQRGAGLRNRGVDGAQIWVTTVSGHWGADGLVSDLLIPADGSVHTWRFEYDPDARIEMTWPDANMPRWFSESRLTEDALLAAAKQFDAAITRAILRSRLEAAARQGLIIYDPRRGTDYWERRSTAERYHGAVTFWLDNLPPERMYLEPGHRDQPTVMDRFGIVNQQTYGRAMELYLSELVVGGRKIDLSDDAAWQGHGNRRRFVEREFHARQDYGYSLSNHAGNSPGEIGGTFWRTEPVDPLHGYYGDVVGRLTLDDRIEFSGSITFLNGQPDSAMWFGYFNAAETMAAITDEAAGYPTANSLGIVIDGPTRVGWYFRPLCAPTRELASYGQGPVFLPNGEKHRFRLVYDPRANDGVGRITVTLDEKKSTFDLTARQRATRATFDHFGLVNVRRGGKFVEVYLDDLSYTARRAENDEPKRHKQQIVEVPYPEGGRKY